MLSDFNGRCGITVRLPDHNGRCGITVRFPDHNCRCGITVRLPDHSSNTTKDKTTGICCFSAQQT